MLTPCKGVRKENNRRMLAKNWTGTTNTEMDRQKQGWQRTPKLQIKNRCPWSEETTWSIAWTYAVQQHASVRSGQDPMLRTGNKEEEQERKRSEVGIVRYIKSSFLRRGSERNIRHIPCWRRAGRTPRNTQENHVRDSRCESRVAGRLFQPSEKETLPPGTGLDKCLQTQWVGYQTTVARRWLPGTSWPGGARVHATSLEGKVRIQMRWRNRKRCRKTSDDPK